jgi:hypothetical protein
LRTGVSPRDGPTAFEFLKRAGTRRQDRSYRDFGNLATIGRRAAVVDFG